MKKKAKWMHCFCSTGSVMRHHYSSCCLFKQLFFPQGISWYIARFSRKISFDLVPLPFHYLYFFQELWHLFATVVLCGHLKCTMDIPNRKEDFEIDTPKSICANKS
jgi:hypothetical protein